MRRATIIPGTAEIIQRIQDCRAEIAALKKLLRAAQAAETAEELLGKRVANLTCGGPDHAA